MTAAFYGMLAFMLMASSMVTFASVLEGKAHPIWLLGSALAFGCTVWVVNLSIGAMHS